MARLNQIIAVEKGVKARSFAELTEAQHSLAKAPLLSGIARTYQPKDEEGETYPPESTKVQVRTEEVLKQAAATLTRLFDVTATKDWANCTAKADVLVDGTALLTAVPATYLLFLEKQLADLHTLISKLPVLDAAESWSHDSTADCYATEPVHTTKTKKVMRNHLKYEATENHPAQVEVYTEDIVVGQWRTVKFSGALPASRVKQLLERVDTLTRAVKFAREEANNTEVTDQRVGERVFGYLFA